MMQFATSTLDVILSRKPDELIGAFMLALMLSFAAAKLFTRLRREAADGLGPLVGLMLVVSLTSLVVAAGYISEGRRKGNINRPPPDGYRPPDSSMAGAYGPSPAIAPMMFRLLDADGDGRITPVEGSQSVERFIRDSGRGDKGGIDLAGLTAAVNQRIAIGTGAVVGAMAPPPMAPGPPQPSSPEVVAALIAENTSGLIFEAADADRDGSLSPAEAGAAAVSFIRAVEAERGHPLDLSDLRTSLKKNLQPQPAASRPSRPSPP